MSTHRLTLLAILVSLVAIGQLAFNIYLPSLPKIGETFAASPALVKYTITLYLLAFAFGQLFIGMLSDRYGRKTVLLVGLSLFVASCIICAFADSLGMLIGGRILQAIGGCAGFVIARAIVRDMHDQNSAASMLGYITMAMIIAPSIAPFIGGYVEVVFGWRANFIILATLCLAVISATAAKLPESNLERTKSLRLKAQFHNYGQLLTSVPFLGYALTASFASSMFFAFAAASPFIFIDLLELTPAQFGAYFAFAPVGFMIGNFISGKLSVKYGTDRMIEAGNAVALSGAALMLALAFAGIFTPLSICLPFFLVTLSNGLAMTNSIAGAISVNPKLAGTAAGLAGFMQMCTASSMVWLTGLFQIHNQFPMIVVIFGCGVMAFAAARLSSRARTEALKKVAGY